jgi:hypothetical protein
MKDRPTTPLFRPPPVLAAPRVLATNRGHFLFECPLCKKRFRYDDRFEPICTGPSESRDDHSPEVMRMIEART